MQAQRSPGQVMSCQRGSSWPRLLRLIQLVQPGWWGGVSGREDIGNGALLASKCSPSSGATIQPAWLISLCAMVASDRPPAVYARRKKHLFRAGLLIDSIHGLFEGVYVIKRADPLTGWAA